MAQLIQGALQSTTLDGPTQATLSPPASEPPIPAGLPEAPDSEPPRTAQPPAALIPDPTSAPAPNDPATPSDPPAPPAPEGSALLRAETIVLPPIPEPPAPHPPLEPTGTVAEPTLRTTLPPSSEPLPARMLNELGLLGFAARR